MKFEIRRTSLWDYEIAPCSNCVKEEREGGQVVWTRNFETLDDLMAFMEEVECYVVMTEAWIEIYDDYRE